MTTPKTAIAVPNGVEMFVDCALHMRDGFELAFEEREPRDHEAEADECQRRANVCKIRPLVCKRVVGPDRYLEVFHDGPRFESI